MAISYSKEGCVRIEHVASQIDKLTALCGDENLRYSFIMLVAPMLLVLDDGAVDEAFERLLKRNNGPLCYGLIYQEVRQICAERGLDDPDIVAAKNDQRALAESAPCGCRGLGLVYVDAKGNPCDPSTTPDRRMRECECRKGRKLAKPDDHADCVVLEEAFVPANEGAKWIN